MLNNILFLSFITEEVSSHVEMKLFFVIAGTIIVFSCFLHEHSHFVEYNGASIFFGDSWKEVRVIVFADTAISELYCTCFNIEEDVLQSCSELNVADIVLLLKTNFRLKFDLFLNIFLISFLLFL